jgi:ABC-type transport system involved in multi-copper enzyme maturation permease subunit
MSSMTAPLTPMSPRPSIDLERPGIPLSRLVRVECRKLVDTRAGFWLLAAVVGISALEAATVTLWGTKADNGFKGIFGVLSIPGGLLLPVLAVLLVTSEWSQRSGLITFTVEPRRSRTVAAKFAVLLLTIVAAIAATLLLALAATLVVRAVHPGAGVWNLPAQFVAYSSVGWFIAMFQGFAYGLVFRNSAAGIVGIFAVPVVWTLASTAIPALHDKGVQPWIDVNTAEQPLRDGHVATAADWAHLASSSAIWILIPLLFGTWLVLRSEVK